MASVPTRDLGGELLLRLKRGDGFEATNDSAWLGSNLLSALQRNLDVHNNRFSRQHYNDLFNTFHAGVVPTPAIRDKVFVDLGCGSVNPYAMLFLFLMLGAERGIGVDLDKLEDECTAVQALADLAGMLLVDPHGIVGNYPITRAEILQNLSGFDLGGLRAGSSSGISRERLQFRNESVSQLSLRDGEADFVFSNAFLEHVPNLEAGIRELARIAKPGSLQAHNIDTSDHRRYGSSCEPLDFLCVSTSEEMVFQSNRLRLHQIMEMFDNHGFEVLGCRVDLTVSVPDEKRMTFVEPFRSLKREHLEQVCGRVVVRKR